MLFCQSFFTTILYISILKFLDVEKTIMFDLGNSMNYLFEINSQFFGGYTFDLLREDLDI